MPQVKGVGLVISVLCDQFLDAAAAIEAASARHLQNCAAREPVLRGVGSSGRSRPLRPSGIMLARDHCLRAVFVPMTRHAFPP
jgi:hypothetical protein